MVDLVALERLAKEEYADIVMDAYRVDAKLRVLLTDESYLDFWWSEVEPGRFAHHWNRQHVDGTIHRHDNSPHRKWQHIEPTFRKPPGVFRNKMPRRNAPGVGAVVDVDQ